jgi:hypothetical protein
MGEPHLSGPKARLTAAQAFLEQLWNEHLKGEFETRNTEDTLNTMVLDAYVNHVPVMTGGVDGLDAAGHCPNGETG